MYNTEFKVKYYDIETELTTKYDNEPNEEYTKQDIFDVCNKLYNDELTTVFYAENIYDDKIDKNIHAILDVMMKNVEFASIIDEAKSLLFLGVKDDVIPETNEESEEKTKLDLNSVHIVSIIMFSKHMFYLTHKCICQQLVSGTVDSELLVQMKNELLLFLNKQY
jgi:hypothetical protein